MTFATMADLGTMILCAAVLIQSVRLGQALVARRKAPLSSWLM